MNQLVSLPSSNAVADKIPYLVVSHLREKNLLRNAKKDESNCSKDDASVIINLSKDITHNLAKIDVILG